METALSRQEQERRRNISIATRKMVEQLLDVEESDDTSIMLNYHGFYLQLSFSEAHPLMVIYLAHGLSHAITVKDARRINDINQRSILGSHSVNSQVALRAETELVAADGSSIPADGLIEVIGLDTEHKGVFTSDLPFGRFYAQELATDNHYILNDTRYPIIFDYAGPNTDTVHISIHDGEPISNILKRGKIDGRKINPNGDGLEGAVIGLFPESVTTFTEETALMTTKTEKGGAFSFANVPIGHWQCVEIAPATGYILGNEIHHVYVTEDGQTIPIQLINAPIMGHVRLTKVDADYPDNKLSDAVFYIYEDSNGDQAWDKTDEMVGQMQETEPGVYELRDLLYNGYFCIEQEAPTGFELDQTSHYFRIENHGETVEVETEAGKGLFNNAQKGSLRILKTSSDGRKEGFAFRIAGTDITGHRYDQTFTTDSSGEILVEGLRVGEYSITELRNEASAGYKLADAVTVEIVPNETLEVKVHNDRVTVEIPKTGDTANLMIWGLLLCLAGTGIIAAMVHMIRHRHQMIQPKTKN